MGQRWAGGAGATARSAPLQFSLLSARGAQPAWDVRISRRARRLSMRVFPGGRVEVVVPPGVGIPAIERFVARHRDWAERRSREFALQPHRPKPKRGPPGRAGGDGPELVDRLRTGRGRACTRARAG